MQSQLGQLKQRGREAFERREYAVALEIFQSILEEYPDFADIRHFAALSLVLLGRAEEALAQLDAAIEASPSYVEAHINRALVLQDLGRYDEAREAFEQASELELQTEGRFPAAAAARIANAHAALGDLYTDAGAPEEAAGQYHAALELRPRFHDIRNKYAAALLSMGRADEAAAELRRVLEWHPRFLAARLNLGLALHRLGQLDEAAAEWELCRAQAPDNPQLRAFLAMGERGTEAPVRE